MTRRNMHVGSAGRTDGFTLIELLVVVMIIGMLMSMIIGLAAFVNRKNLESRAYADIETIRTAFANYEMDSGELPPSDLLDETWTNAMVPFVPPGFSFLDPWDNVYLYERTAATPQAYKLYSMGQDREHGTPETDADNVVAGRN